MAGADPEQWKVYQSADLTAQIRAVLDLDRNYNLPFGFRRLVKANTGKCPEGL